MRVKPILAYQDSRSLERRPFLPKLDETAETVFEVRHVITPKKQLRSARAEDARNGEISHPTNYKLSSGGHRGLSCHKAG